MRLDGGVYGASSSSLVASTPGTSPESAPSFSSETGVTGAKGFAKPPSPAGRSWLSHDWFASYDGATGGCTTEDGFLTSGDIVVSDEDGFLYVVDRKKDMIISGGVNIAPREVEDVLRTFPGVADCAVVGRPDELWGERVTAFVVAGPGASVDAAALEAHCRERLSGPKVPRSVEFLPALPRNAAGKVLKRELRDR